MARLDSSLFLTCGFVSSGLSTFSLISITGVEHVFLLSCISILRPVMRVKAMPHGSDFYNEFAKIHQIYEKSYRAMDFSAKSL